MAYSAADLAQEDRDLAAADKPILGANAIVAPASAQWRTSGSFASGSDATESGFAAANAYDGFTDETTRPDSAQTTWYYMLDFTGALAEFDFAAILGHNFGTIGGLTVSLEIADDNAFTTNLVALASFTPGSSNKRLVDLILETGGGTARRYSSVQYARIKITGTSGKPEIGELILGKRTQLQNKPNRPYNPDLLAQGVTRHRSDAGVITTVVGFRAMRRLEATITVTGTTKIGEVKTWFDDTRQGTKAWSWVEDPGTLPANLYLMTYDSDDFELAFDEVGPNHRELVISALEQGPDLLKLE